jgi:hypothetical protein
MWRAGALPRLLLELGTPPSACTRLCSSWSQLSTPQQTQHQGVVAAAAGAGAQEGAGVVAGGVGVLGPPAPGQQARVSTLGVGGVGSL